MTRPLPLFAALLLALPLQAEEPAPQGNSLIEQGAQLMLRGLMSEMQPALDDMSQALREAEPLLKDLGPQLADLIALIGDFRNYDPPVVLPNGDILIRRKPGTLPAVPLAPQPGPNGEVEL